MATLGIALAAAVAQASPQISVEQAEGVPLYGKAVVWGSNNYGQHAVPEGLSDIAALVSGDFHFLALRSDGTVVAWGRNDHGRTNVPEGLSGVIAVAAGGQHSLALKADGSVVAWGDNTNFQAEMPASLAGAVALSGGIRQSLIVRSNGSVLALGRDTLTGETLLPPPAGLRNVASVASGVRHNLALKQDGTVTAWGDNFSGETIVPSGLAGVTAIAAGHYWSLALKSDGTVVTWGDLELSLGSSSTWTPLPEGLDGVKAIAAGRTHGLALKQDGRITAWGYNGSGQIDVPAGRTDFTAIAAGYSGSAALQRVWDFQSQPVATASEPKTFVVRNQGTSPLALRGVTVSGTNAEDFSPDAAALPAEIEAGGSASFTVTFTPANAGPREVVLHVLSDDPLDESHDIILIGSGLGPEIEITGSVSVADGDLTPSPADETDFGSVNVAGGSAVRTFTITNTGTAPLNLTGTPRVVTGGLHASDFTVAGELPPALAAGESASFQIVFVPAATGVRQATLTIANDDHNEGSFTFGIQGTGVEEPAFGIELADGVRVGGRVLVWGDSSNGVTTVPSGLSTAAAVSLGDGFALALRHDGRVLAWGLNHMNQTAVPGTLTGVTGIDAGGMHSLALRNNGTVAVWGGGGSNAVPAGLAGVTEVSAGYHFSLALKNDGTVAAWGSTSGAQVPASLAGVRTIAAGREHALALKRDGRVVAWGANGSRQRDVPEDLTGVAAIAAGRTHSVAVRNDGTVVTWGGPTTGAGIGVNLPPPDLDGVRAAAAGQNVTLALLRDGRVVAWGQAGNEALAVPAGLRAVSAIAADNNRGMALQRLVPFGNRPVGELVARTFVIRNSGNAPLTLSAVQVTGDGAADFALDLTALDAVVAPSGGSTTFTVNYRPVTAGNREAVLRILSNDTVESIHEIVLQGTGTGPEIAVTGAGADISAGSTTPGIEDGTDFGRADLEEGRVERTFTIVNSGNTVLSLTGTPRVIITGPHAADFTVTTQPNASVASGSGSTVFRIAFVPGGLGLRTALVSIPNNDANESPFEFAVQGVSVNAPEITIGQPAPTGSSLTVAAWGRPDEGQITVPSGLPALTAISAGRNHSLALTRDGGVAGWGDATYGQITDLESLSGIVAIAAGDYHSLFLTSGGNVIARGRGDGFQTNVPSSLNSVTAIAAGRMHSLALKSDGKVVAWGDNSSGQTSVPASLGQVKVTAIAAGYSHSLALREDGRVTAWGSNTYGQINVPASTMDVVAIAAGHYHSVVLKRDGTVAAWGRNEHNQRIVPAGLAGVTAIAADYSQTFALTNDGRIVAWGLNDAGQTTIPAGLRPVTAIEAGGLHTLALQPVLFGNQLLGTTSPPRTFTITNSGRGPLTLAGVTLGGPDAGDFTLDTGGLPASLAPLTGAASFTVTFTPGAQRVSRAFLRIENDDIDEGVIDILLTGEGVVAPPPTPFQIWASAASLNSSAALPEADPFGDGVANLLKFAFNLDGAGPDSSLLTPGIGTRGLPFFSVVRNQSSFILFVEFLRRRGAGLTYIPEVSTDLETFTPLIATPVVSPIDATWERVIIEQPLESPRAWGRVRVSM